MSLCVYALSILVSVKHGAFFAKFLNMHFDIHNTHIPNLNLRISWNIASKSFCSLFISTKLTCTISFGGANVYKMEYWISWTPMVAGGVKVIENKPFGNYDVSGKCTISRLSNLCLMSLSVLTDCVYIAVFACFMRIIKFSKRFANQ